MKCSRNMLYDLLFQKHFGNKIKQQEYLQIWLSKLKDPPRCQTMYYLLKVLTKILIKLVMTLASKVQYIV